MSYLGLSRPDLPGDNSPVPSHLILLLVSSLLLLFAWSFIVPIYEAPDEPHHWQVARYINEYGRLPFYDRNVVEANQPPLYYLLIAPFAGPTDEPPHATFTHPQRGLVLAQPPKFYFNSLDDSRKYWPIRVSRLFTSVLSVGTVLFAYLTGVAITGSPATGLLAGWMTALLPQFTFRGMNISNDALVAMTSAAAIYSIALLAVRGYTRKRALLCGVVMGLALSSKLNAIFLPSVFVLTMLSDKSVPLATRFRRMWVLGIAFAILSPFVVRNLLLYGDPLATSQMLLAVPHLVEKKAITSSFFLDSFPEMSLKSFVGVFGWMNVWLPNAFYKLFLIVGLGGLAGLVWAVVRRSVGFRIVGLLATIPLMTFILLIHLNLTFTQPQGRFLFPALTAVAVLTSVGLQSLPGWRPFLSIALILILAAVNVYTATAVLVPAYWKNSTRAELVDVDSRQAPQKTPIQLTDGQRFTQSFKCKNDNLSRVEILMPNWGRKAPRGIVRLRLIELGDGPRQVAVSVVSASDINDNSYVSFPFSPVPNSKDRSYSLELESEGVPPQFTIGVWLNNEDVYTDGGATLTTGPVASDGVFRTYYTPVH